MKTRMKKMISFLCTLPVFALALLLAGCSPEWQAVADQAAKAQIAIESQSAIPEADEEIESAIAEAEQELGIGSPDTEEVSEDAEPESEPAKTEELVEEDGYYYDLEHVVAYLETYHHLPDNYITKNEAKDLGWEGGSVEDYLEDAAIGGDHFGNYEGVLPDAGKNAYRECDIDTHGYKNRGSRRLIYTEDGEYYYSKDHYETFRQVIPEEDGTVSFGETYR